MKKEELNRIKNAKSKEEIIELAKKNGFLLNEEEALTLFNNKTKIGELNDDNLTVVTAGAGGLDAYTDSGKEPKYHVGQELLYYGWCTHDVKVLQVTKNKVEQTNLTGRNSYQYKYKIQYENSYMNFIYGEEWVWEYELDVRVVYFK